MTSSYTDPTGTVVGFLCRRFRTTLPAFYSGEYAQPHFLLIARELILAYNKQVVNNKLAIHPTLNR
ncbi:hypothetical protein, partial [Coleofasciculus chthonoplastes]|uniref:hypothetical protein n=1 Tax=Coleofasciculus chthonoplastes TaxID=64178 RepID=UPI0032F92CFC